MNQFEIKRREIKRKYAELTADAHQQRKEGKREAQAHYEAAVQEQNSTFNQMIQDLRDKEQAEIIELEKEYLAWLQEIEAKREGNKVDYGFLFGLYRQLLKEGKDPSVSLTINNDKADKIRCHISFVCLKEDTEQ